ncbi:DUF523 domain-containing protein [Nocardia veterana]|uniref:DUF523 domain-containing protein n=1 Tax=Nocardia veterana TaxID=132249 RepID=A0A7X6RJR8_9NOCA|nr:DUF523 domain-containing protein [Nocardia veterana]NKY88476.1 DUF523 domain-containing protein [Nocardia veterana]
MTTVDVVSKVMVSACLAGIPCRYNGGTKTSAAVLDLVRAGTAVPFCAETAAGLTTPRRPVEIVGGDGHAVLDGDATAVDDTGTDMTRAFIAGARLALDAARENGATTAILTPRSPSCGCGHIYDGTFTGTMRRGDGVTAALLRRNGITVVSPAEVDSSVE